MKESLFEEFLDNFRFIDGHVIKWWSISDDSIIIEDDEGYYYLYDSILKTTRTSKNIESLLNVSIDGKVSWMRRFGREFYRAVLKSGYNQEELSLDTKIASGSISAYTNGEKIPSIYILLKLIMAMGCTIGDLVNILGLDIEATNERLKIQFIDDMREWSFEFSMRLIRIFRKREFSQREFGETLGISQGMVSLYFKGVSIPNAYIIYLMIKEMHLNIDEIKFLLGIV